MIYGIAGYKTHAKALLVVRRQSQRIQHMCTWPPATTTTGRRRLYSDLGLMTTDRYAGLLAVELVKLGNQLLGDQVAAPERWQCLREILGQLSQLRRDDHRALHTRINHERWHRQVEAEDAANAERARKKERDQKVAPYYAAMEFDLNAEAFGGGQAGRKAAAHVLEIERNLPPGTLEILVDRPNPATKAQIQKPDNVIPPSGASACRAVASERRRASHVAAARQSAADNVVPSGGASASRADLPGQSVAAASASGSEFRLQAASVKPPSARRPEPQTPLKSNQIKPDQIESNQKVCAAGDDHRPPEVPATGVSEPDPATPGNTK